MGIKSERDSEGKTQEPADMVTSKNFQPGELLVFTCEPQNIDDPFYRARLFTDYPAEGLVERAESIPGVRKSVSEQEAEVRKLDYVKKAQPEWAKHFDDYVLGEGVCPTKLEAYKRCFVSDWVDGKTRRQNSETIMRIKSSLIEHDREYHQGYPENFVINRHEFDQPPLFEPGEVAAIYKANEGLIEALLPDWLDELGYDGPECLGNTYVRRGVYLPEAPTELKEYNYLSSYSLCVSPAEQFSDTRGESAIDDGIRCLFSGPVGCVQQRIVAFAPFIEGMSLDQMELVVAPPVRPIQLKNGGEYGGILELTF